MEPIEENGKMVSLGIAYFAYYAWLCLSFTYLPTYFLDVLHFSGKEISLIYSGMTMASMIGQPFWGQIADASQKTGRIVRCCGGIGLVAFGPMLFCQSFFLILASLWLVSFCMICIPSLLDTLSLTRFKIGSYGKIRVWGSIGYGFSALVFPAECISLVIPGIMIALGICSLAFATIGEENRKPVPLSEEKMYLGKILKNRAFLALCFFGLIHWSSICPYNFIFDAYRQGIPLPARVTGYGVASGIVAECLMIRFSPRWLPWTSARRWLMVSACFTAFRWASMAYPLPAYPLIAIQTLHGLSYGAFFVSSISYLADNVPEKMRATGQTLYCGIIFGGGSLLGNFYTGMLLDSPWKGFGVFGCASFISLAALVSSTLIASDAKNKF